MCLCMCVCNLSCRQQQLLIDFMHQRTQKENGGKVKRNSEKKEREIERDLGKVEVDKAMLF